MPTQQNRYWEKPFKKMRKTEVFRIFTLYAYLYKECMKKTDMNESLSQKFGKPLISRYLRILWKDFRILAVEKPVESVEYSSE